MAPNNRGRLLSIGDEARVFRQLRGMALRNTFRDALRRARLRFVLVVVLTVVFWWLLFVVSSAGLDFLNTSVSHDGTRGDVIRAVFGVFFASLTIMLVVSTAIVLYGALFRSRETEFLMTTPARTERVFLLKLQESILFSSWGFVLLCSPLLIAYGLSVVAPWYYYVLVLPMVVGFALIPGAAGGILCLLVVRFLPRSRWKLAIVTASIIVVVVVRLAIQLAAGPDSDWMTPAWFQDVVSRLHFSEHRLLPSWWLSTGLLRMAGAHKDGQLTDGMMFLALIVANGLFGILLAQLAGRRWLREAVSRHQQGRTIGQRGRVVLIDTIVTKSLFFLPARVRLLIEKDMRLFRRDPIQFSQFLIFFALLGLYFVNVRRFQYDIRYVNWVNIIGFLNLAVVGLILSTFTSRFVFPMVSLEGRRFWILGQLPLRRDTILWSKFWFAVTVMTALCTTLVVMSDMILRLPTAIVLVHLFTCVVLCTGLSGIAVGLGARLPNLTETSPSKIAAGFGGTLTLVISSLYIIATVLIAAMPSSYELSRADSVADLMSVPGLMSSPWVAGSVVVSCVFGLVATWLPMWIGLRAFRRLEV
jgi:ABC-2 type transport system permease protein